MVPEQWVGVEFVQIAGELRWAKDGAKRTNRTRSVRPIDEKTEQYTDTEVPTLVTFAADDNVNVGWLLENGMITVHEKPTRSAAKAKDADEHPPTVRPLAAPGAD